jgi:molybdopterin synthase catalytic subunit
LRVRYFALCREKTGCHEEEIPLSAPQSLKEILETVMKRHPELQAIQSHIRTALNHEYAPLETTVTDQDELALLPPLSGGASPQTETQEEITLTSQAIQPELLLREVGGQGEGAVVLFTGTIRPEEQGRAISGIDYEIYPEMARVQMQRIAQEIKRRWPILDLRIVHRHGWVPVGEAAVAVAVASAHRKEAFEACSHAIERIKDAVPIWKARFGPNIP